MTGTDQTWPFENDANRDDPLTELRIPVVNSFNPRWNYVAAYLDADPKCPFDPPWPFASMQRPTDAEAQMLASYLQQHRHYWFGNEGYARKMDQRPLDVDSGWNTTVFIKYGENDWGYRRCSWTYGPTFVPGPPGSESRKAVGALALEQVMDRAHTIVDEPMPHWVEWKAAHPEVFGCAAGPKRIQRERTKGWRAPAGAKYVGRGTRWGNPFVVKQNVARTGWHVYDAYTHVWGPAITDRAEAHQQAVDLYREWAESTVGYAVRTRVELAGRDLMCWCPESMPCHASVLLELANAPKENPTP